MASPQRGPPPERRCPEGCCAVFHVTEVASLALSQGSLVGPCTRSDMHCGHRETYYLKSGHSQGPCDPATALLPARPAARQTVNFVFRDSGPLVWLCFGFGFDSSAFQYDLPSGLSVQLGCL